MEYTYKRFSNVAPGAMLHGYTAGDKITCTAIGTVQAINVTDACEQVFIAHNRDERSDGRVGPSMSIGDVVILRDDVDGLSTSYACTSDGFERIGILDLNIDPRFWIDIVQDARR